ncbi:hypothetical protein H2200_011116 [Cladophialophora chaetospira]|uniref:Apple domain-containing protein n=1 Tax=Cladophialophora chaetospira TaxID=386627 RepID=A0AA39CDK9_9EURO|nr:hypothetical protein H2200_011116 [Cladophialophora chaetospira]
MKRLIVLATTILSVTQQARSFPRLEERAATTSACKQDNLYNAFTNPAHRAEASTFCSAYISIPLTFTTTTFPGTCTLVTTGYAVATIHPLYLYNLQPLSGSATPITYNTASPSPSPVPGGAQNYGSGYNKRDEERKLDVAASVPTTPTITPSPSLPLQELVRRSSIPPPTWLSTTYPPSRISSACSCISPSAAFTTTVTYNDYTQITVSHALNFATGALNSQFTFQTATCTSYSASPVKTYPAFCAPSLQVNAPQPNAHANWKVTPTFSVASKMDCCDACANVFNCVWWKFDFGTKGNGWSPGQCHYAYYIGKAGDIANEAPAICPNGLTQGIGANYPYPGKEAPNNQPGYNFGPCGNVANLFESSQDFGYPDDYQDCGSLPPPYYTGECENAI